MRDTSISFEETGYIDDISGGTYDIVFVDEASYTKEAAEFLDGEGIGKVVFFSARDTGEEIGRRVDTVIKKPFLPSQIQQVIDRVASEKISSVKREESVEIEEHTENFLFPLSEEESVLSEVEEGKSEEHVHSETKVLDQREIEQIKALLEEGENDIVSDIPEDEAAYEARKIEVITKKLEEDGLEIVQEEDILPILSQEQKKKNRKKKKKAKKSKEMKKSKKNQKKEEETYSMEEALLAAIENMKPKKIKKLLKGAEVTIKIRFKDEV
jgi:hypothetical protein